MSVYLEPDPGARQRARERSFHDVEWHGRKREQWLKDRPGERPAFHIAAEDPTLATNVQEFVSVWLSRNVAMELARPLADAFGQNLSLREAAEKWGVDHRRLSDAREALQVAVEEVL